VTTIVLAITAVALAQVPMPSVVPPTLVTETADAHHVSCTITDRKWARYQVELRQDGGRAYLAPKDDQPAAIFQTEYFVRVVADETGKMAGLSRFDKLIEKPGYGYGTKQVELGGNNGRALVKVSEVSAKEFSISIVWSAGRETEPFVGFCDVTTTRQAPLSDAETKELLRR
jgi:hypothetical protein